MNIHLIKTEEEYDKIMEEVLILAKNNPKPNTADYEKLMLLSLLIEEYDKEHYSTPPSDPIEAIKFRMEQQGLKPIDMRKIFGTTSRYYEVITGKRSLSVQMIRNIHKSLNISADILINESMSKKTFYKTHHKTTRKLHHI
jgi:HTH-type transcriptional regulator/antitoxin HigA